MFRPEQLFQSSIMALKVHFLPRLDLCLECFMGSFVPLFTCSCAVPRKGARPKPVVC